MHSALTWLLLMLSTLLGYSLAEASAMPAVVALILLLGALKGALLVERFMELSGVTHPIRLALHLYCPLLGGAIWLLLRA